MTSPGPIVVSVDAVADKPTALVYVEPDRTANALVVSLPDAGVEAGGGAAVALTDAPVIETDASLGHLFTVTLGGDRTLANPTNLYEGQRLVWRIAQDATGNRALTLDSVFNVNPAVTGLIALSTDPGQVDYLAGAYRAATADRPAAIDVLAFGRGF
jgi:hypothetical protein